MVEAAVAAADPAELLFNTIMSAFHGLRTKQIARRSGTLANVRGRHDVPSAVFGVV